MSDSTRHLIRALAALLCLATGTAGADVPTASLTHAQSAYLESCGGCHGLQGISARELVPDLRDRAGYWLCTPGGREYVVRLPNVAFAARSDEELADLLNFVVFGLGGNSAPRDAKPYTATEVAALRSGSTPFVTGIRARRREIAMTLIKSCGAPAAIARRDVGY